MSTTGTTAGTYSRAWRLISVIVLRPLVRALIRSKWDGRENIPRTGGVLLVANHLSYIDWAPDGAFLHACGRYPVFMIKASAFEVKGIGGFLRKAGQLPVHRGSRDAALALSEAEKRLAAGAAVVIYPEGTATRDPARWPMAAKTGVARLALATGVPVIPVAHWGTQDILPYGEKKPRLLPRKSVHVVAGRPVDLSQWAGQQHSAKALRTATDAIMAQVAELVGQLRGETPPPVPYDPRNPAAAGPQSMTRPLPETPPGQLGWQTADPPPANYSGPPSSGTSADARCWTPAAERATSPAAGTQQMLKIKINHPERSRASPSPAIRRLDTA